MSKLVTQKRLFHKTILLHVDEMWLKGNNKRLYYKVLRNNIEIALQQNQISSFHLRLENERFYLDIKEEIKINIFEVLSKICGLNRIIEGYEIEQDFDFLLEKIFEVLPKDLTMYNTFAIRAKRSNKTFSTKSNEIQNIIGGKVLEKYPHFKVKLSKPSFKITIHVLNKKILFYYKYYLAPGGLPVGSSGKMVTMLSGGIDSPVASFLMAKRGIRQDFIFFYAYPYVGEEVKQKLITLGEKLKSYHPYAKLHIIPFGTIQKLISNSVEKSYRTIAFRHFMLKVSEIFCRYYRYSGIITGDALGQVASQTLYNLEILLSSTSYIVLRPLIGFNKIEIVDLAKKINCFETSIIPHDDACALFAPKKPVLNPNRDYWQTYTNEYKFENELQQAFSEREIIDLNKNIFEN